MIHYRYLLANVGAATLNFVELQASGGIPGSTAPVRQPDLVGDNDNLLEAGETWLYTSTATVTQAVLNAGVEIVRTATAETRSRPGCKLAVDRLDDRDDHGRRRVGRTC